MLIIKGTSPTSRWHRVFAKKQYVWSHINGPTITREFWLPDSCSSSLRIDIPAALKRGDYKEVETRPIRYCNICTWDVGKRLTLTPSYYRDITAEQALLLLEAENSDVSAEDFDEYVALIHSGPELVFNLEPRFEASHAT